MKTYEIIIFDIRLIRLLVYRNLYTVSMQKSPLTLKYSLLRLKISRWHLMRSSPASRVTSGGRLADGGHHVSTG